MSRGNCTYSPKAHVFRKSYGDIHLTVILEEPASGKQKERKEAVKMLKDEIYNFLNDLELEEILNPQETNKSRQD